MALRHPIHLPKGEYGPAKRLHGQTGEHTDRILQDERGIQRIDLLIPGYVRREEIVRIGQGEGSGSMLQAVAGQSFRPIGTPLTFTGISQSTLDLFAPQLMQAGLVPVAAAGGASRITPMKKADENTLRGGASVSMMLTRGDYSMAAAGTVTMRDGDKVYAFGHPFLSLGTSDLPMSESSVITVVPSVSNSFKLAVPEAMVGSMTQDRATGVFGTLGRTPRMIPVKLNVETSRGGRETVEFEIAQDDFLTPLLLNITVYNAIVAQERSIGDSTVMIDGSINLNGQEPIKLNRRFAGQQASMLAAGSVATPVNLLLRGRFDELDLEIHLVKEGAVLSRGSRSSEKFMHGIKVLMAKNYIDNLSEEVKKGLREKAEQGLEAAQEALERAAGLVAPVAAGADVGAEERETIVGGQRAHPIQELVLGHVGVRVADRREHLVFALGVPVDQRDGDAGARG